MCSMPRCRLPMSFRPTACWRRASPARRCPVRSTCRSARGSRSKPICRRSHSERRTQPRAWRLSPKREKRISRMSNPQIIVPGASRGIGEAIALELDRRGFAVAGFSRGGTTAAGTGYACDMTDEAAVTAAIAKVAANGPIVGLVNNAGAHEGKKSAELSLADFESTMRLNASAVLVACREVYPHLKANKDGLIVNIGSFFDKLAVIDNLAYCASKAAVGAITRCLAAE